MNILIPMAGEGSRFASAGYTFPKPVIAVGHKPMIQMVVESLNLKGHYIYIVRKEHYDKYSLEFLLNEITPGCSILFVDSTTEGAACTTLVAKRAIDSDDPLVISNSDHFIEWNSSRVMDRISGDGVDAAILTFESLHPMYSFSRTDPDGRVVEVREKRVISRNATVGVYYWKRGRDYVRSAEQMIAKNIRHNNEFYVAPAFNEAISNGLIVKNYDVNQMWCLGTPEALQFFLDNYRGHKA